MTHAPDHQSILQAALERADRMTRYAGHAHVELLNQLAGVSDGYHDLDDAQFDVVEGER